MLQEQINYDQQREKKKLLQDLQLKKITWLNTWKELEVWLIVFYARGIIRRGGLGQVLLVCLAMRPSIGQKTDNSSRWTICFRASNWKISV